VSNLFNELNVGFNPALVTKGNDALLTSRLRTTFVATQGINSPSIKIVTEGNKVYLLGWVTQQELEKVLSVTRQTSGVNEVVNLMEIVTKS
jgi:osmotically-inducible protein OsmY